MQDVKIDGKLMPISLDKIVISKTNPRKSFDEEAINELAQSILQKGVIQPILLRPSKENGKYELVCGERRYRGSQIAAQTDPARNIIPAYIRELSDDEAFELQIQENLQRKDIHPMEEAFAFKLLMDKYNDAKEVSARASKKERFINQRIKLNDLTDNWQKAFYRDKISLYAALRLCVLPAEEQAAIWKEVVRNVKDIEEVDEIHIQEWHFEQKEANLKNAPFPLDNPNIVKAVGPCTTCQFNSQVSKLFVQEDGEMTCHNMKCFVGKCKANFNIAVAEAMTDPEIIFLSTNWNTSTKFKGHEVLCKMKYDVQSRPTKEKDIADYEKAIAAGKFKKAIIVEGNDKEKGRIVYVTVSKPDTSSAKKASIKDKAPDKVTVADITNEIQRIKDRDKRNKELDNEKIGAQVYDTLRNSTFCKAEGNFSLTEYVGIAVAIYEVGGYTLRDEIGKMLKCERSSIVVYKKLTSMGGDAIKIINQIIRQFVYRSLAANPHNHEQKGTSAAALALAKEYAADKVTEIFNAQKAVADKRTERMNARLKGLEQQKKDLSNPKTAPEKPKGQGVKALLPDAPVTKKPVKKSPKKADKKKAAPAKKAVAKKK